MLPHLKRARLVNQLRFEIIPVYLLEASTFQYRRHDFVERFYLKKLWQEEGKERSKKIIIEIVQIGSIIEGPSGMV